MSKGSILVVDDERSMRDFLSIMLRKEGYDVTTSASAEEALDHFGSQGADLIIADMKMPGMDGIDLLKAIKADSPEVVFIMVTAYASVDTAIEAMKSGAYDYFTKPFNVDEIKLHVHRALEWKRIEEENERLKGEISSKYGFKNFIGTDVKMAKIYKLIMSVATAKTNVMITGESGTGKELVARAVHSSGPRRDAPFVSINCGAIPENLLESEIFGHQKGAFTGAVSAKAGLAEVADGGTLFLDEVTELPLNLQVKLLRFIQERVVRRVGGTSDIAVDIRVVAATNRAIETEVAEGRFREDLFYRLNVIAINVPPLRDRKSDIAVLIRHFIDKFNKEQDKSIKGVSHDAMALLTVYDYPGNVRELENAIEGAIAVEPSTMITPSSLPVNMRSDAMALRTDAPVEGGPVPEYSLEEGIELDKAVLDFEMSMIEEAMNVAGGVKKKAAELLGISFRQLRYKLEKYGSTDK